MGYQVFVSYRREGGSQLARLFHTQLNKVNGINTFLDVADLGSSYFDDRIKQRIEEAPNFLLILTPNSLNRCGSTDDWIRQEIALAMKSGKNIVPVFADGFAFPPPSELPDDIRDITRYNGIKYDHEYFNAAMDRIVQFLDIEPGDTNRSAPLPQAIEASAIRKQEQDFDSPKIAKLVNALRVYYRDGVLTERERGKVEDLAADEGISLERLDELEANVRAELGATQEACEPKTISSGEAMEWPEIGIQFLRKLKAAVEPKLPFQPGGISEEDEEEENMGVWWYASEKHHYSAWLYGKKMPNVILAYGFYSDHERRDPLFRTIADDIQSKGVVPNAEDDETEEGACYFLPEGVLGVYAEKRVRIDELVSPALLEETSARFSDFIAKTWPVISPHYVK